MICFIYLSYLYKKIKLKVEETNLHRQIIHNRFTVGMNKVKTILKKFIYYNNLIVN
jgi:molybdopterin/thiamine biosynthesis adenylyltransferase